MNQMRYAIGLDFGSLSCRGVLVNTRDGSVRAEAAMAYPHAVMTQELPDGTPLQGNWCLQHPDDFEGAMEDVIRSLVKESGVSADAVIALGIDCTAGTVLPLDDQFLPLCRQAFFSSRPHAWPKMWKHHGATKQAEMLNRVCLQKPYSYLDWYGGKINPECLLAKVMETCECDPKVYSATAAFMEMGDYLTSLLCGKPVFSAAMARAKAFWRPETGYPEEAFFSAMDPKFTSIPQKLMNHYENRTAVRPGECAGHLCETWASRLGLLPGIAVSAPQMDGYTPMLALGIKTPGEMMLVMGTSTSIMLLNDQEKSVEGITACLPDTYYPGLWGYASGQASVGDCFDWFVNSCLKGNEDSAATHRRLMQEAEKLAVGESGLIALDWLNGNKSVLGNSRLSGLFLGLHMGTTQAHMYRALLEATAFGARKVRDAYLQAGVPVNVIRACGGIANKNPLMMQIYADVLGVPLYISRQTQAPAKGMAIYAAAAAGEYPDLFSSVEHMSDQDFISYLPDEKRSAAYEELYQEYLLLHDYFGRGINGVMERMYARRLNAGKQKEGCKA